jgi:hypothetical protein
LLCGEAGMAECKYRHGRVSGKAEARCGTPAVGRRQEMVLTL